MNENKNPCREIKLGDSIGKVAEESIVTLVGQISQKDIDDGTVLIFRIDEGKFPKQMLQKVAEQITQAVSDTFQGQVKAMILPQSIEVQVLRDILQDAVERNENE